MERIGHRAEMIFSVPTLRARQVQQMVRTERLMCGLVAERTGRSSADLEVRHFAAALIASWSTGVLVWMEREGEKELMDIMDRCLAHLEAGVPL